MSAAPAFGVFISQSKDCASYNFFEKSFGFPFVLL